MATIKKLNKNDYYNGNRLLKADGVDTEYNIDQIEEYKKCSKDPIYFIRKYVKIVHVDKGIVLFNLYGYQERIIKAYHENRKVIVKSCRQSGKTQTTAAYFLWLIIFHSETVIAIMANKAALAREILSRIQFSYENLPFWLQPGVKEWNKGSITLSNNSKILTSATSPNAARGNSAKILYIDELGFIPSGIAEEFLASVFPIISSGTETKIFLSSTPKGMNTFYKMWSEAEKGINGFVPVEAHWYENPNRDEVWLEDQRKTLGEVKFNQEILTQFLGSSKTLLSGVCLSRLVYENPIFEKDSLAIFEDPIKDHSYVCSVDTSRGQHLDYSAFIIVDITQLPYRIVSTYKNNQISPMSYPFLISQVAKKYNDAHILVEVNDIGGQVSDTLFYEFEYENMYFTYKDEISEGANQGYPGIRTTKKVKSVGCSNLKDLIEGDQLIINSVDILSELSVFVQKGASYAAEDTEINDDLTACCFLFAYLTKQPIFSDLTNTNIRSILAAKTEAHITENMIPFGHINTGNDAEEVELFDIPKDHPDAWIFANYLDEELTD